MLIQEILENEPIHPDEDLTASRGTSFGAEVNMAPPEQKQVNHCNLV